MRAATLVVVFTAAATLNSAYATTPPIGSVVTVRASHYGHNDGFHGKRAANGKPHNKYALTAAHKTLPLGTKVELCNKAKKVCRTVTITDRGPFVKGRDIDVASIGVGTPLHVGNATPLTMRVLSVPEKRRKSKS